LVIFLEVLLLAILFADKGGPTAHIFVMLLQMTTFLVKITMMIFVYIWVRWTLPRFRYDQLQKLGMADAPAPGPAQHLYHQRLRRGAELKEDDYERTVKTCRKGGEPTGTPLPHRNIQGHGHHPGPFFQESSRQQTTLCPPLPGGATGNPGALARTAPSHHP
jgi:hypothetical protein